MKWYRRTIMEEFEKLYTVEDIAKIIGFTSRTIRNYLKDGTLQGRKIGGQWRFTMDNIKQLLSNAVFLNDFSRKNRQQVLNFLNSTDIGIQGKIQVCTVIDCYCKNQRAGHQIYEKLVKVINAREKDTPAVNFNYEFMPKGNKARFTLFGDPDYVIKILQLL
jgi:excisionase family DNA binding protein